jgi:hypothetical protein
MEIVRKFNEAIEAARKVEVDVLADGGASSWDDYRYRVGVRRGLMKALRIFEDVLDDIAKSEDANFLRRDT